MLIWKPSQEIINCLIWLRNPKSYVFKVNWEMAFLETGISVNWGVYWRMNEKDKCENKNYKVCFPKDIFVIWKNRVKVLFCFV